MFFQLRKLILWPRIDAPPRVLQFAVIGSPILASLLFLWFALRSSAASFVAASLTNCFLGVCATAVVYELVGFRRELRQAQESSKEEHHWRLSLAS
jgi:hypothetical protein